MSVSRSKTWIAGEVLTASDLNAEFNNILNNDDDLGNPATKAYDLDGNELILDGDGDTSLTADTDNQIDVRIAGADDFRFTANTLNALAGSTFQHAGNTLALEFIASSDASADASLDFTGFDSSNYDGYLFVLSNVINAQDDVNFQIRTSTDGGSNYDSGASDYVENRLGRDSADANDALITRGGAGNSISLNPVGANGMGSAAGEDGYSGIVYIMGPHLAKRTGIVAQGTYFDANGNVSMGFSAGFRDAAEDVDAAQFLMSAGNIESGTITMYGIRNS